MDLQPNEKAAHPQGTIRIRPATSADCGSLCALIYELAAYQGFPQGPKTTVQRLLQDGFPASGSTPLYFAIVVEDLVSNAIVGYALFYHVYSTWRGRAMFLEDIYVKSDYRQKGVGRQLFAHVCKFAVDDGCDQLRLNVLEDNYVAKKFYAESGYENISDSDGWECGKLDTKALIAMANSARSAE